MSAGQTVLTAGEARTTTSAVLEARALTKRFGDQVAVEGFDLAIAPGEIYCLLGPNGAGKTTTINLFLNFVEPTSGAVMIRGKDVTAHPIETKRHIAYIPEQVMLYRNLTGVENLEYFSALAGKDGYTKPELIGFLGEAGLAREALARYDERLTARRDPVRRYRFFSPAVLTLEALNDIAGTGDARFAHFRTEVWRFADEWKAFFVPRILNGTQMTAADIASLPEFVWNDEPARAASMRVLGSLLALVVLGALAGAWSAAAVRRYRVVA